MKIKKILGVVSSVLLLSSAVFAQDDFGFDSFGDDGFGDDSFGSDFGGGSSEPAISISGSAEIAGRSYLDLRDSEDDRYDVQDYKMKAFPAGKLQFDYSGNSSDVSIKLKLDENSLGNYKEDILDEFTIRGQLGDNWQIEAGKMRIVWGKGDKLHVLDNFNANDYTDYIIPDYLDRRIAEPMFHVVFSTAGNFKMEGVYTPMMTPDRLGDGVWTPKASRTLTDRVTSAVKGQNGKLGKAVAYKEAVTMAASAYAAYVTEKGLNDTYAAGLTQLAAAGIADSQTANFILANSAYTAEQKAYAQKYLDTVAQKGVSDNELAAKLQAFTTLAAGAGWTADANTTQAEVTAKVGEAATAQLNALSEASSFDASELYTDTRTLEYGQGGLRATFTLGSVDLGLSYYYGHYKQPSFNAKKFLAAQGDTTLMHGVLDYDKLQVFGFEGAYVIPGIGLNTRWEAAYNLTDDVDGDDPYVHNNSIAWVFGFDRDLPIHNVNFNIQTQGKFILNADDVKDNALLGDVDFIAKNDDGDNHRTNNKIVVDITDSFSYEKVKIDLKGIYGIEQQDLLIMPTLTIKVKDGFNLDLSGLFIWCKDEYSEFDGWEHNSFAQVKARYSF